MRTLVDIYDYCIAKPGTTEDLPFGPAPLVYKVGGKIYVFVGNDETPPTIAVKGQPEHIAELRDRYSSVVAGPYLNAKHWATIRLTGEVPDGVLRSLVDASYALVVKGLPKAKRP
jgi:predicted DNA-binding protein (MmcQ/YjbR family)